MNWQIPQPNSDVSLEHFAKMIRVTRLCARFVMPLALQNDAALVGRIRGAWGHALLASAKAGDQRAFCALEYFFGNKTLAQKPFSITADEQSSNLLVTLNLFGAAEFVRECAFDALIMGMTEGAGLSTRDGAPVSRLRLRLIDATWERSEGVMNFPIFDRVNLKFLTPFKIGATGAVGTRYSDLFVSAAMRCSVLAHWQGLYLDPDLRKVRALAQSMHYQDLGLYPLRWDRRSSKRAGQLKAMMGLGGSLIISNWRPELTPLLLIGSDILVGAETSFGLGRYVVI